MHVSVKAGEACFVSESIGSRSFRGGAGPPAYAVNDLRCVCRNRCISLYRLLAMRSPAPRQGHCGAGALLSKEMAAVFDEASRMKRDAEPCQDPQPVGTNAPMKKRKKDGGQPYRDTIGIGNVGRKGGDQRGGVMVKTMDLCNYIYAAGGWEGVRRFGCALLSWPFCGMGCCRSH